MGNTKRMGLFVALGIVILIYLTGYLTFDILGQSPILRQDSSLLAKAIDVIAVQGWFGIAVLCIIVSCVSQKCDCSCFFFFQAEDGIRDKGM